MTVSIDANKKIFSGNGVTTVFPLTSPAILVFDATHVKVTRIVNSTGVETILAQPTDYSVSNLNSPSGATITTVTAPATGTTLVVERLVPYTQGDDLQPNTGLPSDTVERRLDLLTMQTQQLSEQTGRALKGNVADAVALGSYPVAATRATKVAGFNASGDPTVSTNTMANMDAAVTAFLAGSNPVIGTAIRVLFRFSATGGQTTFSGTDLDGSTLSYAPGLINVRQNGLVLAPDDYTASNGTSVVLAVGATLGDEIIIEAFGAFQAGVPSDGTVTTAKLGNGAVTTAKIADANVTTAKIADANITTAKIADKNVTAAKLASDAIAQVAMGRLTLTSSTPVTAGDVTAATSIFYTPYNGDKIGLYDGTDWRLYTFTERTLSLSGLAANTNYDVFLYDNAGTLTLEAVAWTNATTRATALATQNGVQVKSGQTSRRYVGTFRTTASTGQTEDSVTKRYVWNVRNRVARSMFRHDSTDNWTYSTASFRQANGSASNQLDFVRGLDEDAVDAVANGQVSSSGATFRTVSVGVGLDSTTAATGLWITGAANNTFGVGLQAFYKGLPGIGYHYLAWLERGGGADTQTWVGDNGAGSSVGTQTGITATILA